MTAGRTHRGVVLDFDVSRGLGTVRTDEAVDAGTGGATHGPFPFHCVSITDGSRAIRVGQAVGLRLRPGRGGEWEAVDLAP